MKLDTILTIIYTVLGFTATVVVPFVVAFIKKVKALKTSKNIAEKEAIINEMLGEAQKFVCDAEEMYKSYDALVKNNGVGESSGKLKKDKVMTNLQTLCLQRGINFDADFWSEQVERLVSVTKKVNVKNA